MKIHPDQIEGVRPDKQQKANRTSKPGEGFGDLLNQEVAKANGSNGTQAVAPPLFVNPLLAPQAVSATRPVADEQATVGKVESVLGQWDDYAAKLGGGASLKEADAALNRIEQEVTNLKQGSEELAPGLKTIVDELDSLTAAERFKFNRGDYV